jgi:hypothetical protein
MSEKSCERCGAKKPEPTAGPFALFSFCAECSQDLCEKCMAEGCCGHVPALRDEDDDPAL